MKELLETIAKALVSYPDEVSIVEREEEGVTVLSLTVNKEDMGKVIGKQGRIAKSIRTVMKAASALEDKHINVEIVDVD